MSSSSSIDLYGQYLATMRKVADTRYASALLQWDQDTYLQQKGDAIRGQQIATLSEITHQLFTSDPFGTLLEQLSQKNDLAEKEKKNISLTLEDYTRQKKLPADFV